MSTSREMARMATQAGILTVYTSRGKASRMKAVVMSILSAAGSRMAPRVDFWLKRRAIQPSRRSVMPAAANSTQASVVCPYHTAMAKKGTAQIRNRVRMLGTVITMAAAFLGIVARGAGPLVISVSVFPLVSDGRYSRLKQELRSCLMFKHGPSATSNRVPRPS